MNIHVFSSVHQYADSPKFPKRAINFLSRYLRSSSSVNQFLFSSIKNSVENCTLVLEDPNEKMFILTLASES